jgi:hypothetical protein
VDGKWKHFRGITGILFFGTPHGGADPRGIIHHIVQKVVETLGFGVNKQVVDTFLSTSDRLEELRDEFLPMVREKGWIIYCFQEQYGKTALQGRKVCLVSFLDSSCLTFVILGCRGHLLLPE